MLIDGWMPIEQYCEKHHKQKNTLQRRVAKGLWQRGVHYSTPDGCGAFVHEERCLKWERENKPQPKH